MNQKLANDFVVHCFNNVFSLNRSIQNNPETAKVFDFALKCAVEILIGKNAKGVIDLPILGSFKFPYHEFGNVSTVDLINFSELSLFRIYAVISKEYDYALDLGANIGLHSMAMSRAGFNSIVAIEADLLHKDAFVKTLNDNEIANVTLENVAISSHCGHAIFSRLLGNTTGSHIAGSKEITYGEIAQFELLTKPISDFLVPDKKVFIKMDIEGHEADALLALQSLVWDWIEICLEIGSSESAVKIFEYCVEENLHIFCEKLDWKKAATVDELPINWRGGSVLITKRASFMDRFLIDG
jgi:FkbM family methyltransferase